MRLHKPYMFQMLFLFPSSSGLPGLQAFGMSSSRRGFSLTACRDESHTVMCPAFAESISEGDIRFEKAVGDAVAVDEVVCEVETDKTSVPGWTTH